MTPEVTVRRGFTIVEVTVATFLTVLLSLILATGWRTFAVPAMTASAVCRLAMEARLATNSIAYDVSGCLPPYCIAPATDPPASTSNPVSVGDGVLTAVTAVGVLVSSDPVNTYDTLNLQYSVNNVPFNVQYRQNGTQLLRTPDGGPSIVVANDLTAFKVDAVTAYPWIRITMQFNYLKSVESIDPVSKLNLPPVYALDEVTADGSRVQLDQIYTIQVLNPNP